jgi:hypothetical protein
MTLLFSGRTSSVSTVAIRKRRLNRSSAVAEANAVEEEDDHVRQIPTSSG